MSTKHNMKGARERGKDGEQLCHFFRQTYEMYTKRALIIHKERTITLKRGIQNLLKIQTHHANIWKFKEKEIVKNYELCKQNNDDII